MKANVAPIVRAHYRTLVDADRGRALAADYLVFVGAPLAVFVGTWLGGVNVPTGASVGLLTVAGVLSAFLFGVVLQVAERASEWADSDPEPGPATSRRAILLGQISANAGYASLVCIVTCAAFVVVSVSPHTSPALVSAIGLGLATHLVLVLFMVLARVFKITQERLVEARAGSSVARLSRRRAS